MDFYMNSAGVSVPCIREYDIDTANNLVKGTVLTLYQGKAKVAASGDTVLGILAEDYNTAKEELNPRSGMGKVKVIVSPGMICKAEAQEFTVETAGDATTINVAGITVPQAANALAGGFVQLVAKAENSANSDHAGLAKRITASAGAKLTVENGGVAQVGDVYRIYPPAGCKYIALCNDAKGFELSATESKTAKVALCNTDGGFVEYTFTDTFFN